MSSPSIRLGFFDKQRRDKKQRIFEKPQAPFNLSLAFIGGDDLGIAQLAYVHIGPKHEASLDLLVVLNRVVIRTDLGLDWPLDGLQWGARCGSTFAGIVLVFTHAVGCDLVVRPALGQGRQRLLGHFRRLDTLGVQVKVWLFDGRRFALPGVVDRRLGALKGRLRMHDHPALRHAIVASLKTLIAGLVIQTVPGVPQEGLRDHLRDRADGLGNPCDQAEVGEVGGIVLMGAFRVCD